MILIVTAIKIYATLENPPDVLKVYDETSRKCLIFRKMSSNVVRASCLKSKSTILVQYSKSFNSSHVFIKMILIFVISSFVDIHFLQNIGIAHYNSDVPNK